MTRSRTGESIAGLALAIVLLGASGAPADVTVTDRWRDTGKLTLTAGDVSVVLSKDGAAADVRRASRYGPATVMRLAPYGAGGAQPTETQRCRLGRRSATTAECRVGFGGPAGLVEMKLTLRDDGAIRVDPESGMEGLAVAAEFAHALLPSRHVDDNIYTPADYPDRDVLHAPAENMLVGLVPGEAAMVVAAWPSGDQAARVRLSGQADERRVSGLEIDMAGQELYVGQFHAAGIWHAQALDASFEQQDTALDWTPPFEALWKTQLVELGVPTTFRGMREQRRPWRPTVGFYIWPFYEVDDQVYMHLHKRLAHDGHALIYALEGSAATPYEFMASVLSVDELEEIAELQPVERYYVLNPDPVRGGYVMNAHCAGRDQLKATTFMVGAQFMEREFLSTHISDRAHECEFIAEYHVQRCLTTMEDLASDLETWIDGETENPDDIVARVGRVATRFRQVIEQDAGLELAPEALALVNELNAIISMEEDQGRRFGSLSRRLFQLAAYECAGDPQAAVYARMVRTRLRDHLRYRQYESPQTAGYLESLLPDP